MDKTPGGTGLLFAVLENGQLVLHRAVAQLGHARHVSAQLENGVTIHNCYVPAGGDIPDREQNEKFGQKLDYLTQMRDYFCGDSPDRAFLVGDLNIALLDV